MIKIEFVKRKSVTLVELMIAAVFLSTVLASIIGLFIACSQLNSNSRSMTRAVTHLSYVMEQVKSVDNFSTLKNNINDGVWNWSQEEISGEGLQSLQEESILVCCYDLTSGNCLATCPSQDPLGVFAQVQWRNRNGILREFGLRTFKTENE